MSSSVGLFLGFIIVCLLVNGHLCLQCYDCNASSEIRCTNANITSCPRGNNICSAVSVSLTAGDQTESRILKGCDIGLPTNKISNPNSYGIRLLISKRSCNSELCNQEIINITKEVTDEGGAAASDVQCFSCFSTNKSKCTSAVPVKCPAGFNTCYEATGTLAVGFASVPIFVKQCSVPTNVTNIQITGDWFSLSLNAAYCTGNLCNNVLIVPPETTTVPTTSPTTKVPTTEVPTTKNTTTTIIPAPEKTTSGTGRTYPFSVAFILLVVVKSFL